MNGWVEQQTISLSPPLLLLNLPLLTLFQINQYIFFFRKNSFQILQ